MKLGFFDCICKYEANNQIIVELPYMKVGTQESQVVEKLREEGGYATLRRLNEIVDTSIKVCLLR